MYTCSEDEYPMLDLTGKKRRCVGDMACLYVLKGLRTENNVCVTREAWLAQNPRNFVDKRFEAVQYRDEPPLTAEKVCGNWDDSY